MTLIAALLTLPCWLLTSLPGGKRRHPRCRDVWPVQSARIICAKPVDMLNGPVPVWW